MKIIPILIMLVLLVIVTLLVGCGQAVPQEPAAHPTQVVPMPQAPEPIQQTVAETDLYIIDGDFSPAVIAVKEGQLVRIVIGKARTITVNGEDKEVPFDLSIPDFGVETEAQIADMIEFTADKVGEFGYFCMDCSPQIAGTIIVE